MTDRKPRRATSKQVAERAGVSQTTVSFVLNNVTDANISEETRQRVLRAARDLNYVPDMAARSLARGRSNNIALVVMQPHQRVFIDEYLPSVLMGMSQVTQKHGLRILVELVGGERHDNVFAKLLQSREAAGLIVNFSQPTGGKPALEAEQIMECAAQGLPIVSLAHMDPKVYSVEVDKFGGVRTILHHLLSLGHQRIACITYAPNSDRHASTRLDIFREVLKQAGLSADDALIRYGEYDPETGYQAMKSILQEASPLPTALYAMNDMMAFGALEAIHEAGLRVPEDIAVVGFDNIRLAAFSSPPLTTMHDPNVKHGQLAAELLLNLIDGKTPPQRQITLEMSLVVRESCGASHRT